MLLGSLNISEEVTTEVMRSVYRHGVVDPERRTKVEARRAKRGLAEGGRPVHRKDPQMIPPRRLGAWSRFRVVSLAVAAIVFGSVFRERGPTLSAQVTPALQAALDSAKEAVAERTTETLLRAVRLATSPYIVGTAPDTAALGALLARAGLAFQLLGQPDSALAWYGRALRLHQTVGDRHEEGSTLRLLGENLAYTGRSDSALRVLGAARTIQRAIADTSGEAFTSRALGRWFSNRGRPDSALSYLQSALLLSRTVRESGLEGIVLNDIGVAYADMGEPDSALVYYRAGLTLRRAAGDRRGVATTLSNISQTFVETGRLDSAYAGYRAALAIRRETGDREGEAATINALAVYFMRTGQADSAINNLQVALALRRAIGDVIGEAHTTTSLAGLLLRGGQTQSAIDQFRRALALGKASGDVGVGIVSRNGMASAFAGLGQPDSAIAYWRSALALERVSGNTMFHSNLLSSIGAFHAERGQGDSAVVYFRAGLVDAKARRDPGLEAQALTRFGWLFADLGQPDSALAYHRTAFQLVRLAGLDQTETVGNLGYYFAGAGLPDSAFAYLKAALELARESGNLGQELGTLISYGRGLARANQPDSALSVLRAAASRGRASRHGGLEATALATIGNVFAVRPAPDSALAYYRAALALLPPGADPPRELAVRRSLGSLLARDLRLPEAAGQLDSASVLAHRIARVAGSDLTRSSRGELDAELYSRWVQVWLALSGSVGVPQAAAAGFAAAERGRAQGLLDLMGKVDVRAPGADLAREGDSLLAAGLGPDDAVLSYLVTTDTLLVWWRPAGGTLTVFRRPVPADSLAAWVRRWRGGLGVDRGAPVELLAQRSALEPESPAPATAPTSGSTRPCGAICTTEVGARLAALLLPARLPDSGRSLVIIPHGSLNLLPFAALPIDAAGTALGRSWRLVYAPSVATRAEALSRPAGDLRATDPGTVLVVGDPTMPTVSSALATTVTLEPLPAARAEARRIGARLGVDPLLGGSATESRVRAALPGARVVHLATHGFAYSRDSWTRRTFVALAPDSSHDGRLTVGELLDDPELTLQADLVVLSACETGLGDVKRSEGTIGFQRAFLAKGARTVLVSLWQVDDEATGVLLDRFYAHLVGDEDGPGPAEALRRAQLDLWAVPRWRAPRYWAGFQVVGAG